MDDTELGLRLAELSRLHDAGALTEDEVARARQALLGSDSGGSGPASVAPGIVPGVQHTGVSQATSAESVGRRLSWRVLVLVVVIVAAVAGIGGYLIAGRSGDATAPTIAAEPPPKPAIPDRFVTVGVDARSDWMSTGLEVTPTDSVAVHVRQGEWTLNRGPSPYQNGQGNGKTCATSPGERCGQPVPDFSQGALIGRIGDTLIGIGSDRTIVPPQTGELMLKINDDVLTDNDGVLTVEIQAHAVPR